MWIFLRILVLRTKTKRFEHTRTDLQQKEIHGLKPKIREHTGTKRSIKPINYYNIRLRHMHTQSHLIHITWIFIDKEIYTHVRT